MFTHTNFVIKNRARIILFVASILIINILLASRTMLPVFGDAYSGSHYTNDIAVTVPLDTSDWVNVPGLYYDGSDIPGSGNQMDWINTKVAHNDSDLFMLLQNDGPIEFNYGTQIYIDTDANWTTGYIGTGGEFPTGTDLLIQGGIINGNSGIYLYDFTGSSQTQWSWTVRPTYLNMPAYTWGSGFLEMRIPLEWLGYPDRIHFFLDGDNGPMGNGYPNDYVPNNIHNWNGGDYLEYTINGTNNGGGGIWQPAMGATWWWQLENTPSINPYMNVDIYDIDLFDGISSGKIAEIKAAGKDVICYFSAGTYEDWRPDFPSGFGNNGSPYVGSSLAEWEGEKWLNLAAPDYQLNVIKQIMLNRLDMAQANDCDGVEFDNIDGYQNDNGRGISWQNQIDWNIFLANAAHDRGLAAGYKNNVEQIDVLEPYFDFAISEQCYSYQTSGGYPECYEYEYFTNSGKAVFTQSYLNGSGNYGVTWGEFVDACNNIFIPLNMSALWNSSPDRSLDGNNVPCPGVYY